MSQHEYSMKREGNLRGATKNVAATKLDGMESVWHIE
jgi:hypothetical protein